MAMLAGWKLENIILGASRIQYHGKIMVSSRVPSFSRLFPGENQEKLTKASKNSNISRTS